MEYTPQADGTPPQPCPPQIIVQCPPPPKSGWPVRLMLAVLVIGLLGSAMFNLLLMAALAVSSLGAIEDDRVQERFVSHNRQATDKVAILSIEGTILSAEGFFKHQIERARKDIADGSLKALVVRVNSPGGTISGSDEMLYHLRKLAKETDIPIVVSMGGLAASGGYYVSMCVGDKPDTIFAEPSTWTGSIGVIIPHFNLAELMDKWGIQEDNVASNPLKTMGSIARKMTPEERKILQGLVDQGFTQFKNVIKQGRPKFNKEPAALDKLATGQIFTAQQALDGGLIDKIGFVEDAVDRAIALTGLNKAKVKVVKYKAEPHFSEIFFGRTRLGPALDLASLLEGASPRAYYLCTWVSSPLSP